LYTTVGAGVGSKKPTVVVDNDDDDDDDDINDDQIKTATKHPVKQCKLYALLDDTKLDHYETTVPARKQHRPRSNV